MRHASCHIGARRSRHATARSRECRLQAQRLAPRLLGRRPRSSRLPSSSRRRRPPLSPWGRGRPRRCDCSAAYEVPDGDGEVGEYCIQFVSASTTETTCEPLGDGDLTIVQGQSQQAVTSPSLIRRVPSSGSRYRPEAAAGPTSGWNTATYRGSNSCPTGPTASQCSERTRPSWRVKRCRPASQGRRHASLPLKSLAVIPHSTGFAPAR